MARSYDVTPLKAELEKLIVRALELESIFEARAWTPEEILEITVAASRDSELRSLIADCA